MRIGIDARLINETGVGRYIRNLIRGLGVQDRTNEYVVFLRKEAFDGFVPPNDRWHKIRADIPWHTFTEQIVMPWLLVKARLDLVHIPYFNIPILYPGKMVATIHDLIILHFDTGKATTLPYLFYKLRRLGYRIALEIGLRRTVKLIAVSQATKKELIDHFHLDHEKIVVTYEGVDSNIKNQKSNIKYAYQKLNIGRPLILKPYFLYVGNAYPHKNLETLLKALQQLISQGLALPGKARPYEDQKICLVLVGKQDYFYTRLREFVEQQGLKDSVIFFGEADDKQLVNLYTHAKALVFPSLMEGFGLPALEALALGCPVIASDIPVFHETLGDNATYFDPSDPRDLTEKLAHIGRKQKKIVLDAYSWSTLASDTLAVYRSSV